MSAQQSESELLRQSYVKKALHSPWTYSYVGRSDFSKVGSLELIRLHTLGQADLTAGEGRDAGALLAQTKRFAVFCYLALPKPGTLHRRDTLVGVFWPDIDQEHARTDLRQALAFIRHTLGPDVLISRGNEEVGLNPDRVWCDAAAFQDAARQGGSAAAVELYGSEFLKGFFLSNCEEFERWLDAERARMANAYGWALEQAADSAAAAGEAPAALEYCERLVEHDRYNTRYAMKLMEALVAVGDPANALLYAERHREALGHELGIAPPAEFEALVERTRCRSPAPALDPLITHEPRVENDADSTAPSVQGQRSVEPPERLRGSARAALRMPWWGFALASLGTLLVGVALGGWFLKSRIPADTARQPSIAILNLKNLGSPQDSLLALGMTDALVTRLANIRSLKITLGGASLSEGDLDLDRIAERLGASHVLTGTFYRAPLSDSDSRIRVSVQLVDAAAGTLLWAHAFESPAASMFPMYSDIGEHVAQALNFTLLEMERQVIAEVPTSSPQAYEYYLIGNAYFEQGFPIRWELQNAAEMYERAIEVDSGFALAYARLSMVNGGMYWGGLDRSDARLARQRDAADQAIRLDPGLADGRLALGLYLYWAHSDFERALSEFELAREGLADDYWYLYSRAAVERRMGRLLEAAQGFAAASDLRPLAWSPALEAGHTYRVLRRYEEAHRYLDRYIASTPSQPYGYLHKALAYLEERGDVAKAREVLKSGPDQLPYEVMIAEAALDYCMPGWFRLLRVLCGDCRQAVGRMQLQQREYWHYYLGTALLLSALNEYDRQRIYYDSAAAVLEDLIEERPDDAHSHADLALAYAGLGRKEQAIEEARLAVSLSPLSDHPWGGGGAVRKLAEVYATFGEADSAIAQLELLLSGFAAGEESGYYVNPMASVPLMKIDPIWDGVRDHPAFQELLETYDPLRWGGRYSSLVTRHSPRSQRHSQRNDRD